jgi:hypothetical protein
MIRHFVRWVFNLDLLEKLERTQAELRQMEKVCDRLRKDCEDDWNDRMKIILDLEAQLLTARRTAALYRSLIAILRDVNRDLDERNVSLEKRSPEAVR